MASVDPCELIELTDIQKLLFERVNITSVSIYVRSRYLSCFNYIFGFLLNGVIRILLLSARSHEYFATLNSKLILAN